MQFVNQLVQFVQQGVAAVFRFVQLIWTWAVGQISSVVQSPWQNWPLWKQILLALVVAAVIWALYKAAVELWEAGVKVLGAFVGLLGAFVMTLPHVLIAGLIAMGGIWLLNNVDGAAARIPTALKTPWR
jgi:hypothetical protein